MFIPPSLLFATVVAGQLPKTFDAEAGTQALLTAIQGRSVIGRLYNSPQQMQAAGERLLDFILRAPDRPDEKDAS